MNNSHVLSLVLGLLVFSFLINSLLVVPFINFLYRLKFIRRKEGVKGKEMLFDKLHDIKAGTPIGGGILIIITTTLLFGILFPVIKYLGVNVESAHKLTIELFVIFFTFISFGLIGIIDDLVKILGKGREGRLGFVFGLNKLTKFSLQAILSFIIGFVLYKYLGISFVHIPFFNTVINLGILYIPLAAFIILFFTNAFNFTDGLDGLASGLLMIYLFAFMVIAAGHLDAPLSIFITIWLGAIIAFLYFNIYPARIFLGDAGALSFGAMIAVIGLLTGNITALFVIGGIFVIEAFTSLIQILGWKFLNRAIFPIAPIHHTFLAIGWEEPKIVMRAWVAGIVLAIFGLWLATI